MADDKSVSGAAEKILGLLNPKEGQSAPVVKAEPSVEPEVKTQEVSNDNQSTSDEIVEEAAATENTNEEVTEQPTQKEEVEKPNLHRVKVQGQELEVTLDELKSGYSRDSDYRQKTHQLSLEKKNLESEKESLRQTYDSRIKELNNAIQSADLLFKEQLGATDLNKLYEEDPSHAAKLSLKLDNNKLALMIYVKKLMKLFKVNLLTILKKK